MTIDTTEGNKLIAEFIGAELMQDDYGDWGYKFKPDQLPTKGRRHFSAVGLQYHTSWDWLRDLKVQGKDSKGGYKGHTPPQSDIVTRPLFPLKIPLYYFTI